MKVQIRAELGESIRHIEVFAQHTADQLGMPVVVHVNDARFVFEPRPLGTAIPDGPTLEERVTKLEQRLAGVIEHHGLSDGS